MNLSQLISSPTRPNFKCPEKLTLIDLILTNAPYKYLTICTFSNDINDQCVIAVMRNAKVFKTTRFIKKKKICFKHFHEQGSYMIYSFVIGEG